MTRPAFLESFDDFLISQLLPVKDAARLTSEELDVLRANVRSEILFSNEVREILRAKAREVLTELGK
ncbi:hypothetical protein ACFFMN_02045 [Planobispora siamensis]|uniref:Uncharacterized protein n=1 Tax=Planobispora siamensis TaxID=936338 RepID=A0A8J3SIQ0_9ACTN|nr:hypothetical protein [Planobispora siamensis]GIH92934.1 hypothetical protein Psi01_35640 [Planobispora siamensis]